METLQDLFQKALESPREILVEARKSVQEAEAQAQDWPTIAAQTRALVVPQHQQWLRELTDLARGPDLASLKQKINQISGYYAGRWNHPAVIIARLRIAWLCLRIGLLYLVHGRRWIVRGVVFLASTAYLSVRVIVLYLNEWRQRLARWLSRRRKGRPPQNG